MAGVVYDNVIYGLTYSQIGKGTRGVSGSDTLDTIFSQQVGEMHVQGGALVNMEGVWLKHTTNLPKRQKQTATQTNKNIHIKQSQ